MQRQRGDQKEKDYDQSHIGEKLEHSSSERSLVDLEKVSHPGDCLMPESDRRNKQHDRDQEADDERAQEDVTPENNVFVVHATNLLQL